MRWWLAFNLCNADMCRIQYPTFAFSIKLHGMIAYFSSIRCSGQVLCYTTACCLVTTGYRYVPSSKPSTAS
jgi:hypothetical protein